MGRKEEQHTNASPESFHSSSTSPVGRSGVRLRVILPPILLIGIFILALTIRLLYIKQIIHTPIFFGLATDSEEYESLALQILRGNLTLKDFIYLNPLYPFFLAFIYLIFGHSNLAVVLIQAAIDSSSCLLIYYIASSLFNKRLGIVAAFIYACYGIAIFYTGILLAPTLVIFFTLLFIASLLFAGGRKNILLFLISGIFFGLVVLARSNLLLFLFLLPLWFFIVLKDKQGTYKAIWGFISLLVGFFMIISLISIRNYSITKEFSPSVLGGINFYIGNNPKATGRFMSPHGVSNSPIEELRTSIQNAEEETGNALTPSQASRYWLIKGLTFIKGKPLDAFSLYMKKFALFWRKEEISVNIDYAYSKTLAPIFRLPFISFGLIAPFSLLGLILLLRRKNMLLINLFTFSCMLSVIIFFMSARYRLPIAPFLIIYSTYAIYHFIAMIRAKEIERATIMGTVLILLFTVINKNFEYFTPPLSNTHQGNLGRIYVREGRLDEALTELKKAISINSNSFEARSNLGIVYSKKGMLDKAIEEYKKALKINPVYVPAHTNLGNIYGSTGRLEEAISEYKKAIDINPDYAEAHYNLGSIYSSKGMFREAIHEYKKTLDINPTIAEAHFNLGTIYEKNGKIDDAIKEYTSAISLKPRSSHFHINLGNTYLRKGEFDKSISQYKKALTLNPRNAKAQHNLGVAYMRTEALDNAVSAFKKAIDLNPRYTKAYYNLGSVYGRKGMFDKAISQYKKALAINPNSAKTHYNLGVAYDKNGRLNKAISEYKKALNLNHHYAKAHVKLASAYYSKGNYNLALAHCDKARELGGRVDPELSELLKPYR